MKSRREKYEENNVQLVAIVIKLRKKVANLERELIKKNRFAQNQHDENVVLKIKLTEKENYAQIMQSSAIELISQNTMQMQKFLIKTGLKIPSLHPKQENGQIIFGKQSNISIKMEPEKKENGTIQQSHNEKPDSHQDEPIQLKIFEKLVDRTSSSLFKLSSSSDDVQNKSNVTVQRKSLSMAGAMDNDTVSRSPIGKKHTYDDEVNESLRILKERKTGTTLASVPDESNGENATDPDLKQASESSNHLSIPFMPQMVKRKRRSEINPNFMTPVKLMRSDSDLSPAHEYQSHSQSATDKEYVSTSNHLTEQSIFQNVFITKSPKLEMNAQLLAPVESMRSNTILLRSPINMNTVQPKRSHSNDESVHKRHSISSHAPESSDVKPTKNRGRRPISTQSDGEQTPIGGRSRRCRRTPIGERPRRSRTRHDSFDEDQSRKKVP